MNNCSILSLSSITWDVSWDPSFSIRPAAATGVFIPQARPKTALFGTKQY